MMYKAEWACIKNSSIYIILEGHGNFSLFFTRLRDFQIMTRGTTFDKKTHYNEAKSIIHRYRNTYYTSHKTSAKTDVV